MITGQTKLLGVIGYPVEHSLSPVMHNAAIAHLGVDYAYLPFPIAPVDLKTAIDGFAAINLRGFSVTIPHKQTIMPLLNEISPIAQAIGAVNTVCRIDRGWMGTNTDAIGFVAPLKSQTRDWSQVNAVILGNGGAARAVVAGCTQLGCAHIHVVGRNPEKRQQFLTSWTTSPLSVNFDVQPWEKLPELLPDAQLLVNTTPIGMAPHADASPLDVATVQRLTPGTIVYDLIYTPSPTRLLQAAEAQGAIAIDGLEMLVQQGAAALELWLQQPAPIDVMRRSLQERLQVKWKNA